MGSLLGLVGFAFVASVTPGPNNVVLWGIGIRHGLGRAVPYLLGVVVGVGAMALAVSAGLGVLITSVPALEVALKVVGSAYLLYLAWQVAGSAAVHETDVGRPPTFGQAVAFQFVNVKAWFFVLTAVAAFRPPGVDVWLGSLLMTVVIMAVVLPSASVWAVGGHALGRFVSGPRSHRAISLVLALILAGMVVLIWL